ncbi:MAG: IS1182 family transposase, partial [Acidobacteriota bacterium]|nr:IS1182 family transposase [Acidobacteriota bacterium]
QAWLLPPSVMDFVPPDHLAHFVRDTVREQLDLSEILATYEQEERGYPPYHPVMMSALLLYAYCQGVYSSRRIARACQERVDFMAVTGLNRPDFRTVSDFRKRHLQALGGLFVQVLQLCRGAGLVSLGHVALDGTKIKANASKHKAMSYGRMSESERRLRQEVRNWFDKAAALDAAEEREHADRPGDELPDWVADKQRRIQKIREARAALQAEAAAQGQAAPKPKAQRNFTDTDSRIMKSGSDYVQAYNAQAAVDEKAQIIVAQGLSNNASDAQQLDPIVWQIKSNLGCQTLELSADAGYCSEGNLALLARRRVRAYIATGRQRHGQASATSRTNRQLGPRVSAMRTRLARAGRRSRYRLRKQLPEPVFGQIKHARGFRQFLLRGLSKVKGEWTLICTVHNLLKLAKAQRGG